MGLGDPLDNSVILSLHGLEKSLTYIQNWGSVCQDQCPCSQCQNNLDVYEALETHIRKNGIL